mmetsp:Transcript_23501/g.55335  ORF Transcript_23501/g.55335 Transcript_23501/m.55335 type:complete len:119 (-) Transcript_23501:1009-1365(-)
MYYGSRSIHETWSAGGLPISGVEELIKKAHGRHDSAYDGTDGSEKGNVSLSIVFYDLYVERRNLVEEKYPGKTSSTSRIDVSEMFRDTVLVGTDSRSVLEFDYRRNNLEVVLIHAVSV